MQYEVQSRPSRRYSQGNEVERFPKGGVRSRRQRGCASRRSRIHEHGACCSSHLRQNGSSAEDGTSSRRQRGVSQCGVAEILQRVRRQSAHAHLPRSIQCQQGEQCQRRACLDQKGWRLLQRVQQEPEGLKLKNLAGRTEFTEELLSKSFVTATILGFWTAQARRSPRPRPLPAQPSSTTEIPNPTSGRFPKPVPIRRTQ